MNYFSFSPYSFLSRQEEEEEEARAPDPAGLLAASRGRRTVVSSIVEHAIKETSEDVNLISLPAVLNVVKYFKNIYTPQIYVDVPTVTIDKYAGTVHEANVLNT